MKKFFVVVLSLFFLISADAFDAQNNKINSGQKSLSQQYEDDYTINKKYYEYLGKGKEPSKSEEEKYLNEIPFDLKKKLSEAKKIDRKWYYRLLKEAWNIYYWFSYPASDYPFRLSSSELKNSLIKKELQKDIELQILQMKCIHAKENEKSNIRAQMAAKLNEIFDVKETMKAEEIKYLESRINELKASLKERQKNKNAIVEKKLKEVLREKNDLTWD
ncbi:MAG: hypothetical protein HYS25_14205 [Ignavibacteriales bacterium]|nr:hypothetical protein [Ignavibacteriales bacterium]